MADWVEIILTSIATAVIIGPLSSYISYRYGRKTKLDEEKMNACKELYSFISNSMDQIERGYEFLEQNNPDMAKKHVDNVMNELCDKQNLRKLNDAELIICDDAIDKEIQRFMSIDLPPLPFIWPHGGKEYNQKMRDAKIRIKEMRDQLQIIRKMMNKKYFTI